jgi:hypothetical protein
VSRAARGLAGYVRAGGSLQLYSTAGIMMLEVPIAVRHVAALHFDINYQLVVALTNHSSATV